MSERSREILEGLQYQGEDESVAYSIDVTNYGNTPTSPAVDVFDEDDLSTSVKSTVMPTGSPSVASNVITLPALTALTDGQTYRVEVQFTLSGNLFEVFFRVRGQGVGCFVVFVITCRMGGRSCGRIRPIRRYPEYHNAMD